MISSPGATVRWAGADGDWGDAAKWAGGVTPGQNDDAVIDASNGPITVTISTGTVQVNSIQCEVVLKLSGGTILGGTVVTTNGGSLVVSSGTLDGVTVNGTLDVGNSFSGGSLTVLDGLVLNGTAYVGNNSGWAGNLSFAGSQVLGGNGTVVFGNSGCNVLRLANDGTTLVVGPGITVRGQSGQIGYGPICWGGAAPNVSVVNQGKISADVAGGTITIAGSSFNNTGQLIKSASGGSLTVSANTSNDGTIQADHGTISFGGAFTQNAGALDFGMSSASDFGQVTLSGNASVGGTLASHLADGYLPNPGDSFAVLHYGSGATLAFTNLALSTSATWQTNLDQSSLTLVVKGILPLAVTITPTNQTVATGATVRLQANTSGPGPFGYQWQRNGQTVPGATNASLVISNATAAASGTYIVLVSNSSGAVQSAPATLNVLGPPVITSQPQSQTASVGMTVSFQVGVSGDGPLFYQWSFDGQALAGATGSSLVLTNLGRVQAGSYAVVITNAVGSVTSAPPALLAIAERANCPGAPGGMIGWWRGEENTSDYAGTNDALFEGQIGYGPGEVGSGFLLDGLTSYLQVPDSPLWAFGTNDFTVELWANFSVVYASDMGGDGSMAFVGHDEGPGARNKWYFGFGGGKLYFYVRGPTLAPLFLAQTPFTPDTNQWYHLAFTKGGGVLRIYVNGVPGGAETNVLPVPDAKAPLTLGQAQGLLMNGLLDEISLYNRALEATEIQAIYQTGATGKCGSSVPPTSVRLAAGIDAGGRLMLSISGGEAGAVFTVQSTTDFKQWTVVGQVSKNQAVTTFVDPTPHSPLGRYYRVQVNP